MEEKITLKIARGCLTGEIFMGKLEAAKVDFEVSWDTNYFNHPMIVWGEGGWCTYDDINKFLSIWGTKGFPEWDIKGARIVDV